MALTPLEEAKYALAYGKRSDLSSAARAEYDRLLAARQARLEESARRAQEREKRAAATIWMPNLGVAIYDGNVYQHGTSQGGLASDRRALGERRERMETKLLGPLSGAQASIVTGQVGNRRSGGARVADATLAVHALGPAGLLAGAYSRPRTGGLAVVTFFGGGVWQKVIPDPAPLMRAQAEAVRFNALAAAGQPADDAVSASLESHAQDGVASELERLAALHASGALDDEEFRAAKARIIHG
jgi:Short C-terminal domain